MKTLRPVMMAVGGDSGTGKTTITRGLYQIFGGDQILNICLDDYHSMDRDERKRHGVTALNPAANHVDLMVEHVWALRDGRSVVKPVYDHSTGTFGESEVVHPRPLVIIQGLHPLLTEELRSTFDLKVWLDPDEELKWSWKVKRDVAERGYTVEQVIRQIVERQDDVRQYIRPQAAYADVTVRFCPPEGYFRARANGRDDMHLNVRVSEQAHLGRLDLDDVLELSLNGRRPALRRLDGPNDQTILEIDGTISPEKAGELENRVWDHMPGFVHLRPDQIGNFVDGKEMRHSDPLALTQLLLAYRLLSSGKSLAQTLTRPVAVASSNAVR
ncbi:MAG: phosphoribulokinase [Chloroflexi bacterium]|nr:phosphoribulokinase [Chloroflexota bacterium]